MKTETLSLTTGNRRAIIDITEQVERFTEGEGDGLVNVSLPHATAGLALIEVGSGTETDLLDRLDFLLPREDIYAHRHGARGHGADHVLPAFVTPTLTLPVISGRVALGTWQRVALVDLNVDNPRREVLLSFLRSP